MPIFFNSLLRDVGLSPSEVRLVRHQTKQASRGRTPYELWRDNRQQFELYQSFQEIANRSRFAAPHWAVFVANPRGETMFVGLYSAKYRGLLQKDTPKPHREGVDLAGSCDVYDLALQASLQEFIGKLFIDWGPGARAWVQRAELRDKPITELRLRFEEPAFPGFLNFIQPLSKIEQLPRSWVVALQSSRGVYLLTCPKTREQYVGSATGQDGFWGRWLEYVRSGHGGNTGLKSREPSDYQISVLEVAGSSATLDDILSMEGRWQAKLQSREMGLNRNWAGATLQSGIPG